MLDRDRQTLLMQSYQFSQESDNWCIPEFESATLVLHDTLLGMSQSAWSSSLLLCQGFKVYIYIAPCSGACLKTTATRVYFF